MSHYARLILPVTALPARSSTSPRLPVALPIGTEIKSVRVVDGDLHFFAKVLGAWAAYVTGDDLPWATDKGRAHREARAARPTLRRGRPAASSTAATKRVVCKVTDTQWDAIAGIAERRETTVPKLVRKLLIAEGMPE
jgi:hypothetical protein